MTTSSNSAQNPPPSLSPTARDLLDAPEFATIATTEPDGSVQLSVVWIGRDGDDLLVSTTRNRRKTANLTRDPRATVLVYPRESPYTYLEVRGVVEIEDDPTSALIHELARKYTGAERYTADDGTTNERVILRPRPTRIHWRG